MPPKWSATAGYEEDAAAGVGYDVEKKTHGVALRSN
jgi:hypothetical protein